MKTILKKVYKLGQSCKAVNHYIYCKITVYGLSQGYLPLQMPRNLFILEPKALFIGKGTEKIPYDQHCNCRLAGISLTVRVGVG